MSKKILGIDDDSLWRDNFKEWVQPEIADVHVAASPQEAASCIRRQHYDLVLLDLSMVEGDLLNRGNQEIQRYLATRPDGTLYLIVSAVIEKTEVRDFAFRQGASGVIFKAEADPDVIEEAILKAFATIVDQSSRFVADARQKLIGNVGFETEIITALASGGAARFSQVIDSVLRRVAPISIHRFRPQLVIQGRSVLGVLWSRQRGHAVSLALAHESVPADELNAELSRWLGYEHRNVLFEKVYHHTLRVQIAEEPSLSVDDFELPVIPGMDNGSQEA